MTEVVKTDLEKLRETKIADQKAKEVKAHEAQQKLLDHAMPKPAGYMVLIALPDVSEAYESGIIKSDSTQKEEYILSTMGLVVDMGIQAYTDKERFPNGPWCKKGDCVMFRPNSGTRFKIGSNEFRLLEDDSIQAIVPDPRYVARAS